MCNPQLEAVPSRVVRRPGWWSPRAALRPARASRLRCSLEPAARAGIRGPLARTPWHRARLRARAQPAARIGSAAARKRTTAELVESLYTHCYERFATVSLTRVRWPRREECKQKKFKPLRHICAFGAARTAVRAGRDGARISSSNLHDQSMVGSDVPSLLSAASTGSKRAPRHDERGA